jgi:outer membrane protein TolC
MARTSKGPGRLTLNDCTAVALARNLDLQVKRWEELGRATMKNADFARMFPHLTLSARVAQRDTEPYAYSDILGQEGAGPVIDGTATGVNTYHTDAERSTWRYDVKASWSPVEATSAYFLYASSCNEHLKAYFNRVRSAQKIVGNAESAFYRLLGLQESVPLARELIRIRKGVVNRARNLLETKLLEQEQFSRAEWEKERARRLMARLRNRIEKQRNLLARSLAITPEYCDGGFVVIGELKKPCLETSMCELELTALKNRPEAYVAGLDHVNSVNDLRRSVLGLVPKVDLYWKFTEDDNKFLYDEEWKTVGATAYIDLLDWWSGVAETSAAKSRTFKTRARIGAVALGISYEVRAAALEYFDSLDELTIADKALAEARRILHVTRGKESMDDVDRIALKDVEAAFIECQIKQVLALAGANAALANLKTVLGTNYSEPIPGRGA